MFAALFAPGNLPLLLECAGRFSPLLEITSPDAITVDLRGGARLLGSSDRIAQAMQRTLGNRASVALASNPDTALYLSRSGASTVVVPPGEESPYLAPLPLSLLGCPDPLGELLHRWGLRTFGDFGSLPPLGIVARCGQEGLYWQMPLARIRRLVGADAVGTPVLLDTHKPDAFALHPLAPVASEGQGATAAPLHTAFRRFRPPEPVQVSFQERPWAVRSHAISGTVQVACGPWYSSGHWWQADAWQREEWDVGLDSGPLYRIFRDLSTMSWFVEGNYD